MATYVKQKIGKEDIYLDTQGTGETISIQTSTGGTRQGTKLNGSH